MPFAISYDKVDVLAGFAATHGIAYALLSDEGSQAIRALGLLNEQVYEQHAAYGIAKDEGDWGVPYAGVFVLDERGYVLQKRFPQSYRERETGVALLERGFDLASPRHGVPVHVQAEGVQVSARLDSDTYRFFQRRWLAVELQIAPGLHIYGQPIPDGYVPLTIEIAPCAGLVVGAPDFPAARPHRVKGLDAVFRVYEHRVAVSLPLTFVSEGDIEAVHLTVRYQACSATECFIPRTVELRLPVQAEELVDRPRPRREHEMATGGLDA